MLQQRGYAKMSPVDKSGRCRELEPPVEAMVTPVIEGHRYGGASLTAIIEIVAEPVQVFMEGVPEPGLARKPRPGETPNYFLDLTTIGALLTHGSNLDFQWQVEDESGISGALSELTSVLDGPGEQWVAERRTVAGVFDAELRSPIASLFTGRACAVLALQDGRSDVARALVSRMVADRRHPATTDELQRLSAFQAALVESFPDYRPAELPSG